MRKKTLLPVALVLLLSACARKPASGPDPTVTFLDVGQADAVLLQTPENETVVIDTGHNGKTADQLRRRGIKTIDLLVLSHAHADHTGGVARVLSEFKVREIWYSGLDFRSPLRDIIQETGKAQIVSAGATRQFARLRLYVLHPEPLPLRKRTDEPNNRSLVLKAVYGSSQYLFPGDCELGCWEEMFQYHRADLRADVLKAAHHGSGNGTNSGVLINVRPKTFVISCGRNNEFGHPDPMAVTLVEKLGASILRTDQNGTIVCQGVRCAAAE